MSWRQRRPQLAKGAPGQTPERRTAPRVYIFESELGQIAEFITAWPDIETGGDFFGYWTHSGNPVVHLVLGPGAHARHEKTAFYQDTAYLEVSQSRLFSCFGLQNIGEWHSHHRLGLAEPSGGDVRTVWSGLDSLGWPRFLLGIGNLEVRRGRATARCGFFLFEAARREHLDCDIVVLPGESPLRPRLPPLPRAENLPSGLTLDGSLRVRLAPASPRAVEPAVWFTAPVAQGRLALEMKALRRLTTRGVEHRVTHSQSADVHLLVISLTGVRESRLRVICEAGFPDVPPLFVAGKDEVVELAWQPSLTIAEHIERGLWALTRDDSPSDPRRSDAPAVGGVSSRMSARSRGAAPESPGVSIDTAKSRTSAGMAPTSTQVIALHHEVHTPPSTALAAGEQEPSERAVAVPLDVQDADVIAERAITEGDGFLADGSYLADEASSANEPVEAKVPPLALPPPPLTPGVFISQTGNRTHKRPPLDPIRAQGEPSKEQCP